MELPTSEDIFLEYLKYCSYATKNLPNASESHSGIKETDSNEKIILGKEEEKATSSSDIQGNLEQRQINNSDAKTVPVACAAEKNLITAADKLDKEIIICMDDPMIKSNPNIFTGPSNNNSQEEQDNKEMPNKEIILGKEEEKVTSSSEVQGNLEQKQIKNSDAETVLVACAAEKNLITAAEKLDKEIIMCMDDPIIKSNSNIFTGPSNNNSQEEQENKEMPNKEVILGKEEENVTSSSEVQGNLEQKQINNSDAETVPGACAVENLITAAEKLDKEIIMCMNDPMIKSNPNIFTDPSNNNSQEVQDKIVMSNKKIILGKEEENVTSSSEVQGNLEQKQINNSDAETVGACAVENSITAAEKLNKEQEKNVDFNSSEKIIPVANSVITKNNMEKVEAVNKHASVEISTTTEINNEKSILNKELLFKKAEESKPLPNLKSNKIPVKCNTIEIERKTNEYNLLMELQDSDYVSNKTEFICFVCNQTQKPNDGVILKECLHALCKNCVKNVVFGSKQAAIKCPYENVLDKTEKCPSDITQREIMGILSKVDYGTYLENCLNLLEQTMTNGPDCFKLNCYGIGLIKNENKHFFICEICNSVNCISCRAIHENGQCPKFPFPKYNIQTYATPITSTTNAIHEDLQSLMFPVPKYMETYTPITVTKNVNEYNLLQFLEDSDDIVSNKDKFDCTICLMPQEPGDGIVLRECLHTFCKDCICQHVNYSTEYDVKCPFTDDTLSKCEWSILHRDLKGIMSKEEFDKFLSKSIKFSETSLENTIHCKTINCNGFSIIEAGDENFICEVCNISNCIPCKAIHTRLSCRQYQDSLDVNGSKSKNAIDLMIANKEAMICPKCGAIIQKIEGCDGMNCSICKVAICWATKGLRWGPKGEGDTSGGCRCSAMRRCDPSCRNCH